jgi:hypothetical protein
MYQSAVCGVDKNAREHCDHSGCVAILKQVVHRQEVKYYSAGATMSKNINFLQTYLYRNRIS